MGNLSGTVVNPAGDPVAGATVTVLSQGQGFTRTTTTNANGEFRVPLIPQGNYTVTVAATGLQTTSTPDLRVQVGANNSYRLELAAATSTDVVVVTGVRPQQEFSQTTTGVSIDVEDFNSRMPIGQNITALALLAPSAVPADPVFAVASAQGQAPASISGASGGENAFFVNGLNITNFVNGIGGAEVPFYFYQNVEVKTGGYQAEFGRATGGVVNAVTKAGTNDFKFATHLDWEPDDLREDRPNTITNQYELFGRDYQAVTVEASGPIIKDHLFIYGMGQWQKTEVDSATQGGSQSAQGTFVNDVKGDPFYAVKLDGFITDDHHLEFTWFDTSAKRKRDLTPYTLPNTAPTGPEGGAVLNPAGLTQQTILQGGESYVARYTGSFTDNLVLSAAYGRTEVDQATLTPLFTVPRVQDARTGAASTISQQRTAATTFPFLAEREFYRADVDYYVDFFGEHHFKAGFDQENTVLTENSVRNGGADFTYRFTAGGSAGLGLPAGQQYLDRRVFISGGGFKGENKAIYIQDSWDPTDRINIQLGWRQDQFSIADPNGTEFLGFDDEQAIRVGASYDVFGDKSAKLYGFYGRYYLPAASNTSFRAAAPAIDFSEIFLPVGGGLTFGALNPVTGLPVAGLGPQRTSASGGTAYSACPAVGSPVAGGGAIACQVRNTGASPLPEDGVATDVQSTYEDEFVAGYSTAINSDWSTGVSITYRKLGRAAEDILIEPGVLNYCTRMGIDTVREAPGLEAGCDAAYSGNFSHYRIVNPGYGAAIKLSGAAGTGDILRTNAGTPATVAGGQVGDTIFLTAEDLGYPKVRREYIGLTFDFERAFDGMWGLAGSYTISRSEGNFEGALKSDIGQTDAGITEDFDFLSFMPGQYGLLPNHHAHQFKLNGTYSPFENFLVGGNLSVISPRPYGCIGAANEGYLDGAVANAAYGVPANARFCNQAVVDRGSVFTADWTTRFDLSFRYTIPETLMPIGNVVLRADIFNVFNLDSATEASENGEVGVASPDPDYRYDTNIQSPRFIRLGLDFEF